jgi:hypothetical protein
MSLAKLLTFGKGGHALYLARDGGGCSGSACCQGYESPESFVKPYHWWAHPPEQISYHWGNYTIPPEGVPVIDTNSATDTKEGRAWSFHGPMVDVDLPDGEIDRLGDVSPIMGPAVAAFGMTAMVAENKAAVQSKKAGPLDSVAIPEYIAGWRDHGARIGRFFLAGNIGRIEWE